MKNEPLVFERTYKAHVSKVWAALTDPEKMKHWYFDIPEFRPEIGTEFSFEAGTATKRYIHECKVTKAIPNKVIAYTWRYPDVEGNSEVSFELFEEGDETRFRTGNFPAKRRLCKKQFCWRLDTFHRCAWRIP